jgi:hypothetical protein
VIKCSSNPSKPATPDTNIPVLTGDPFIELLNGAWHHFNNWHHSDNCTWHHFQIWHYFQMQAPSAKLGVQGREFWQDYAKCNSISLKFVCDHYRKIVFAYLV